MSNIDNLQGLDKAAILFQVLGESLALSMFQNISEADIMRIRIRSRELHNIPVDLKKNIIEEYYFKIMSKQYNENNKSDDKLFSFLHDLNDEQLFYLLSKEEVKIIALAIEQITPERQMAFLDKLDVGLKNKVIIQIRNLNDIPLEAVVDMASELENK